MTGTGSFDVAVVGGGPAGLSVALQLAREDDLSVAVLEPHVRRIRFGETLPPGCRPLLAQLGVLEAFTGGPHARCEGTMAAWGSPEVHYTDYRLHPEGYGWRIDRDAFEAMLARTAVQRGVTMIDAAVTGLSRGEGWRIAAGDAVFRARAIVDATGRTSTIARRLGARRIVDDQLVGIAAMLETAAPVERDYPLIEAFAEGWLYSSCMPDGHLAVVVMTDSDLAHAARLHDVAAWLQCVAASPHTARRVEGARCVVAPVVASACSQRLDPIAGEDWLAAGDAASAVDPLSSLGILKAVRTGIDASAAIVRYLSGDREAFDAYASRIAEGHERYREVRHRYYAMERRWPASPFWRRRHELSAPPAEIP